MRRYPSALVLLFAILIASGSLTAAQESTCPQGQTCPRVAQAGTETETVGLSAEEIAEYEASAPALEGNFVDDELLHDRTYRQVNGAVDVYARPGGEVVMNVPAGFNFVTVLEDRDGWTLTSFGGWIRSEHLTDSNHVISRFTGIFLPEEPLEYPVAWTLINLYPSSEPGGSPRESNGLLYRYSLVHIYSVVEIDGWEWYQIGADEWVYQTHVSKVQPIERPETVTTEKWVAIDLYEQNLVVYEGDRAIFATLVSTGLPRWPTYEGTFNIYFRKTREHMTWGTPGDDYYFLEEVPWTMFFDEGRALHGAYWHDGLGYRRSHGCVNMSITDAHWLYMWVAEEMGSRVSADVEEGPNVYVYSSGEYQ
jgi:hypothetical protein